MKVLGELDLVLSSLLTNCSNFELCGKMAVQYLAKVVWAYFSLSV